MAVSSGLSCVLSISLSLLVMASMQICRAFLVSSKFGTMFAGFLGSIVFLFMLTSISNLEMSMFGKQFQSKYTEVIISLLLALLASGLVHRISVTTCLLFSITALYFVNRISTKVYQTSVTSQTTSKNVNTKKRK